MNHILYISEKCYIIECKFKEIAQNGIDFYGINDIFWPNLKLLF